MRCLLPAVLLLGTLAAQPEPFLPGTTYDPALPTLQQVVGHDWGEDISSHADVERYARALAAASPNVAIFDYGRSWQGRTLFYLVLASQQNLQRLDAIRAGMAALADPRGLADAEAQRLLRELPAVAWLAYTVHGDEISGSDAGLLVAWHLAAARGDALVDAILRETVVIVDPLQNPDGRDRFVHHWRSTRGPWPDPEPDAAEHNQPWPGGRTNHYLFDMNRDWFALTQPETRARVQAFLQWWPLVYVDLHEMGGNSTYYFAPPAEPLNPEITPVQRDWLHRYGRNNAAWFDRFGIDYFTRENFDAFYPGYGEGWPTFHGSIGMTFEQASARGLVFRRRDESQLSYRDGVRNHFLASLGTLETAARGRQEALAAFLDYRRSAVEQGRAAAVKEYVFPDRGDRARLWDLMERLETQGIEVQRSTGELVSAAAEPYLGGEPGPQTFATGSFVVSLAQPAGRLATVLLSRHQDMSPHFLAEQRQRQDRRQSTEFYDLTGWSLPLLYDVECWLCREACQGERAAHPLGARPPVPGAEAADPTVAWLVPWSGNGAAAVLVELLRAGVKVRYADEPFRIDGRAFPAGSLVVKVAGNGAEVHRMVRDAARRHGADVHAVDSSWVEAGPHFGSNEVHAVKPPRVALAWDRPCSANSAGWARFLLERVYGLPVTLIRSAQLGGADLDRFTVLVLPDGGGYGGVIGKAGAERIVQWLRRGGVLVTMGGSTRWLTEDGVKLLSSAPEDRKQPGKEKAKDQAKDGTKEPAGDPKPEPDRPEPPSAAAKPAPADEPFDYHKAIQPDKEPPPHTPGAILRVRLDPEHWLAFGYDGDAFVVTESSDIYTPVKLDQGTNVAVYQTVDQLLVSGFTWEEAKQQLAQKAYLVHQPHGRGHVVAFAEDPNLRAFARGLNLLFLNAVLLTPGR